jgi:hypothetical protein
MYYESMTMTQIEDANGTTAEVSDLGPHVELSVTGSDPRYDVATVSVVLTPRQARLLAQQLLAQADASEYGDEG